MVTPTYFVYFTTATIISSIVLFRGFKGTPIQIITLVLGFFTICSGVVLLQLSKSAKDVPDTAVFKGDLDQIQTIAEQEQPETEPKADAIRGTAAIVRRLSQARQKMELDELKRLQEEKRRAQLEPVSEEGRPLYEWDGLRRRKTILLSGGNLGSGRARSATSPTPFGAFTEPEPTPHPPLGMSHFPSEEEMEDQHRDGPGLLGSIAGTIRSRARSVVSPIHGAFPQDQKVQVQSPMHPVPLTEISVPSQKGGSDGYQQDYGLGSGGTEYHGSSGMRNVSHGSGSSGVRSPSGTASRQFSFQNLFKRHHAHANEEGAVAAAREHRHSRRGIGPRGYSSPLVKGATEEERLGLVKGDSQSMPALPQYDEESDFDEEKRPPLPSASEATSRYGRGITTPPRRGSDGRDDEIAEYDAQRRRFNESKASSSHSNRSTPPPPAPAPADRSGRGGDGAFI